MSAPRTKERDALHITNGDSAAGVIQDTGLTGAALSWRDVLHEGPVPPGLSLAELRPVRARFIAEAGWGAFDAVLAEFAARDRALESALAYAEIVLWFEHDLYDQLQLLQLLDWFAERDLGATRLSLVCGSEYLGLSTPERLRERYLGRQPISATQLALGQTAWAAFRSPDPRALVDLLGQDTSALPFLAAALWRHLQEFPSIANGLSRSESQALEAIARGVTRLDELYVAAHHEREQAIFLSDAVFAWSMEGLSREREPCVGSADGGSLAAQGQGSRAFWSRHVTLTQFGQAVLDGAADRVAVNGIDRWRGGVHLHGPRARWRWDNGARRLREGAC